ncbi:P2 family phage major capsid protein, partial [Salmonella enterica]|nr:P2 family phage major capsid protein [Salmonella enterica]
MYAFKTERPDAARRYHNKFVTGTNYQEESNRRFALSESTENILRTSILESGWLVKNITLRDVNAVSGNAVNIGASELHTGRVDGGRFHKKMAINGTEFFLTETDTCARISYSDMSHIYHTGVPDKFEKTVESFFAQAYALDMLRIGFNGVSIANTTNPEINK